ncbi:MAG: hypothetical protein KGH79_00885 [Patescibacteria group bacterium]|nr:hypothetical protein [Patescibacteria group bacterium]
MAESTEAKPSEKQPTRRMPPEISLPPRVSADKFFYWAIIIAAATTAAAMVVFMLVYFGMLLFGGHAATTTPVAPAPSSAGATLPHSFPSFITVIVAIAVVGGIIVWLVGKGKEAYLELLCALFLGVAVYYGIPTLQPLLDGPAGLSMLGFYGVGIVLLNETGKLTGARRVAAFVMLIAAFSIMGFAHVGEEHLKVVTKCVVDLECRPIMQLGADPRVWLLGGVVVAILIGIAIYATEGRILAVLLVLIVAGGDLYLLSQVSTPAGNIRSTSVPSGWVLGQSQTLTYGPNLTAVNSPAYQLRGQVLRGCVGWYNASGYQLAHTCEGPMPPIEGIVSIRADASAVVVLNHCKPWTPGNLLDVCG